MRSHSLAVGLVTPGFAFPVLFTVGGWGYEVGAEGWRRVRGGECAWGLPGEIED
ncbi:MAG: hypothetical protein NTV68_00410 [Methanomicrobiales archaeon]|nr:hypothetical protein [Methanomicrobiales archaeon]